MDEKTWDEIAENYYSEIISPIRDSIKSNPLMKDIKSLRTKSKNAIDLGCGVGALIPLIANKFNSITAMDYSGKMIEKAKTNKFENVTYEVGNLLRLAKYRNSFDCAFAINSILAHDFKDLQKIIRQIYIVLKEKGKLFAVLPAMESYLYQAMLIMNKEAKKGSSSEEAKEVAAKIITKKEHDFLSGSIFFEGDKQKALYRFEVLHRFKKAGFTNLKIQKIYYTWSAWQQAGQQYFPEEEPPWDWYLTCEKP